MKGKIGKKWVLALCVAALLVGVTSAAELVNYKMPMSGGIPENATLVISIDGNVWANNTELAWGNNLLPGVPVTKPVTFKNMGTVAITSIVLQVDATAPLPSGWTCTMSSLPTALNPGSQASGTITLTPASNAVAGNYTWIIHINASNGAAA